MKRIKLKPRLKSFVTAQVKHGDLRIATKEYEVHVSQVNGALRFSICHVSGLAVEMSDAVRMRGVLQEQDTKVEMEVISFDVGRVSAPTYLNSLLKK